MLSNLSLKYRIALVIFVLEAIMMTAVLSVTLTESFRSSSDYQKANEQVLLNLVSELSTSALLIEEFGELQAYFEHLIQQPDVVQIQLVDLQGIVVASSKLENLGKPVSTSPIHASNYRRTITVSSPAGKLGVLSMEFTNKTLTEANRKIRTRGIATAVFGMVVIFIVGILAGFILTRRLDRVTKAAVRFAQGDSSAQSEVSGRDELGSLGSTFDQMVKDVTEKQDQLVAQHKHIQLLMDSTVEGIIGIDGQCNCTFVNRACLSMLDYSESDLLSKTIEQIIDLSATNIDTQKAELYLNTFLETDDAIAVGNRNIRIPVEFRSHPVVIDGSPVGAVCTFVDITQRKHHEQELQLHRENLEELVANRTAKLAEQAQIMDQIHDSVITTDLEGIIQTWNKGAEKLFGYSMDIAMGKHIGFVYPEEEYNYLQNQVIKPLLAKGEHETEVRMRKHNGEDFFAHVSLSMKTDQKNQPIGMIIYSMDVTDRKRAEEELHRKSIQLEMANKELESFSYSVSHDLRAPLRSIRGFSQALAEEYQDRLNHSGQDFIERILNGTNRMSQLIEDMLSLSRVTRYEMNWNKVDLSSLAAEVAHELRESDPDRQVDINIENNMLALGDQHLMRILLVNLISNAWKYSSKVNHAHICVGSKMIQNCKVFYVKDNGAGFDMKYADKLFGTFQRLHSAKEFEGTGIGLATAARVVHRHHGQIWAESEEGKGATFYFKLSQLDSGSVMTNTSKA